MNASPLRQRLPCVALLGAAIVGIAVGRVADIPGWMFALASSAALLVAVSGRFPATFWVGLICAFAAVQTWQFRESPAARLAASLSVQSQVCEAEIFVLEAPRLTATGSRFEARLTELRVDGKTFRPHCTVLVRSDAAPPAYGDRLTVRAAIRNVPPPRNPGELDHAAWLANRGIRSELSILRNADVTFVAPGGNSLVHFANSARGWIEHTLSIGVAGTPEAALLLGMTIGDTADLSPRLQDVFRETGTFHVFSVSGLHVGIVAVFLWFVLGTTGLDRRRIVFILIPCLFFYALITGLKPAGLRAATMLSIVAAGLVIDRWPAALNSLGAAGLAILAVSTNELFNPGFQLSFLVVATILLFAVPVMTRLNPLFEADPFIPIRLIRPLERGVRASGKWVAALFAVSVSAWLGSLPLTLFYFHLVSFVSIPANLFIVPLAFFVLAIAAISLVAGTVSVWLAAVFNNAAWLVCHGVIVLATAFADLPGGSRYIGPPADPGTRATLTVLDAQRGGASLLTSASHAWLIDTGSAYFADSTVVPFLRQRGINTLDGIVLTHGDSTHIGGFERIESAFPIRQILDSGLPSRSPVHRRILATLQTSGFARALAGRSESLGPEVTLEVLFPHLSLNEALADDKSVVLRIEAGDFSALLLSDAGTLTENWLLENARHRIECDLLVMGRHTSGHSGSIPFFAAAKPRAIIAAVADFPPSQIPRAEWLAALATSGIALFRQDETGAVTVTIREDTFTITPFLTGTASSLTLPNDSVR